MLKKFLEYIYKNILSIISLLTGFFVKDIQQVQGNDTKYNFRRELVKVAVKFAFLSPIMYSMYIFCSSFISLFFTNELTAKDLIIHFIM
jgi:hypothetical protein